jgi:hypothetical protein
VSSDIVEHPSMAIPTRQARSAGTRHLARDLAALWLFGVTFGFIEAAVVVDLRAVYEPIRQSVAPTADPDSLFPLLRLDQIRADGPIAWRLLMVELARELATLGLLVAIAIAVGTSAASTLAAFTVAFGIWDLAYYAFLKLILGWPRSLATWDLLFLWPVPWSAPVAAPALIALLMVVAGTLVLARERRGRPVRLVLTDMLVLFAGASILVLAFCIDAPHTSAGGMPHPFRWDLYALGLLLGVAAFGRAWLRDSLIDKEQHDLETRSNR